MKKSILFVGGVDGLQTAFHKAYSGPEGSWSDQNAGSGAEAFSLLAQGAFDAVVANVKLPDLDGIAFLDEVARRQPQAFRVILSDLNDTAATVHCIGKGHHHLLLPCEPSLLLSALNQAIAMESWLPSATVQGLISRMHHVPSPPEVYFQVTNEMRRPGASVEHIGELISRDPAISAKILQLANSAVFGLQLQVVRPAEAVAYVGLETTQALLLLAHSFASFEQLRLAGFSAETLWWHSVLTGRIARRIVQVEEGDLDMAEQAFLAGLLHDIGKLLFAANMASDFGKVLTIAREQERPVAELEQQFLGANHAEVGACLLGIWGLPTPVVEAVALHHSPTRSGQKHFSPLTAVYAANCLAVEGWQPDAAATIEHLNLEYLKELGLDQRVDTWKQQCLGREQETAS